jgi:integrase
MSVTVRKYRRGGWEVDIRITLPDDSEHRRRRRAPVASKSAAQRWGEERERAWYGELTHPQPEPVIEREKEAATTEVPTLREFAPRFVDGYARANRQKPSGIAAKQTILDVHLIPQLGTKPLDAITSEDVQGLKCHMGQKAPKTVNNALTVLNVLLKQAVEWNVIARHPCTIRLLPIHKGSARFHDFDEYARLIAAAKSTDARAYLIVLLGGDAGLRCGEMMALEWTDIDLTKRQLCVQRSDWKGHVTAPKSGRLRYVPLTIRLATALRDHRHLRGRRILCAADGSALRQREVQGLVLRAARRANLTNSGVHILRHTFCSHLAMRGAPSRAIQELAGHGDLGTTQRYMHLSPAALDAAIRLLDGGPSGQSFGDIVETGAAAGETERI